MTLNPFNLALRIIQPRMNTLLKLNPDAAAALRETLNTLDTLPPAAAKSLLVRTAAIYRHLALEAAAVTRALQQPAVSDYFDALQQRRQTVRIAVFGAKAGAVYPGIARWIEGRELTRPVDVHLTLFDTVHAWQEDLLLLHQHIRTHYRLATSGMDLSISGRQYYDARANPLNFHLGDILAQQDIYLFCDLPATPETDGIWRMSAALERLSAQALLLFMEQPAQADRAARYLGTLSEHPGVAAQPALRAEETVLIPDDDWHFVQYHPEFHDLMQCLGQPPARQRRLHLLATWFQPQPAHSDYRQHFAVH
ncbi:MAG: hypothetical protein MUE40_16600 [Anaerolineae bacterium]|jgi:hypothetical protein|nr:hypothetical protein [Anaerolineae bacterium]